MDPRNDFDTANRQGVDVKRLWISAFLILLQTGCANVERLAIPKAELVSPDFDAVGTASEPDHSAWDQFLKKYLSMGADGVGRIDYGRVSVEDVGALSRYIDTLSALEANRWSRPAQLAYWSNLYNATTVSVILENYPVDSIRQIKSGFFDLGPWDEKRLEVAGRSLSLHDIEHRIVRPLWMDTPEIHYLLNCAAVGCPSLVPYAYTAGNVEAALVDNARAFINNSRGVDVDDGGRLVLSKIFLWYQGDYGGTRQSVMNHLLKYADATTRDDIEAYQGSVRYVYDWSLNDGTP